MSIFNPYLNFAGNAEEAFNFYRSIFGGEFAAVMRMKDGPEEICGNLSAGDQEKIMHISLQIGKGTMLMASDVLESMGQNPPIVGTNFYISINPDSREEADRLFNALSQDGKVEMPMQDMFWGAYFGAFKDKFGVQWMINYHEEK